MQAETAVLLAPPTVQWRSRLRKLLPALILAGSRGGAVAAQMAAQIAVGALAGASGLGVLQLFTSWSCIAGEVLAMGLPARAMRTVAVDYDRGDAQAVRAHVKQAIVRILRTWLPLAALSVAVVAVGYSALETGDAGDYALIAAAVLLAAPLFSLLRLGADALKGADAPLAAVTLENLGPPTLILVTCLACWLLGQPVLTPALLVAGIAGFAVTSLGLWAALRRRLASCTPQISPAPDAQHSEHNDLRYLWANSVLSIAYLHLPFLLLPWFADTAEIGIYAVAHKLINVITTLLILLAAVFGPAFARAAAAADKATLQRLLQRTQLISAAIYLPFAIVLLLACDPLARVFNLESGALRPFLLILAAGHLINAVTGLSGVMLNMAGAAAVELRTLVASALVAVIASLLVGPSYGALGLACVFSGTIALKNLASYGAARHYLKQQDVH